MICFIKWGRVLNCILFISSFTIGILVKECILGLSSNPLAERMVFYVLNQETEKSGTYRYVFYAINIIFLFYWDKIVRFDPRNRLFLQLINIGVCIWIAFSFQSTLSLRFSLFFTVWIVVFIPSCICVFSIRYRKLIRQITMISFTVLFQLLQSG